jgi:CRISPR/Cas system-associated protein Csx1
VCFHKHIREIEKEAFSKKVFFAHFSTVSDKIKTTYGFDSGVYLVILAIFCEHFTQNITRILTDKGLKILD